MSEQLELGGPETGVCHHCGAKMVEYRFTLNKGLGLVLRKFGTLREPIFVKNLGLTTSQWTNAAKLRYWDLIEPYTTEETERKAGCWMITHTGIAFLEGQVSIPRHVVMYRNRRVRFEGTYIHVRDIVDGYQFRQDYADQAAAQL